jgi:PKD repeat protein
VSDSSTIRINRCAPTVQITAENLGNNMVRVTNDTTGEEPIDWAWDFDNNGTVDSVVKNPADYEYNGPGRYTVVLRATNVCGSDEGSTEVQVTSGSL